MKKRYSIFLGLLICLVSFQIQAQERTVIFNTSEGTMKAILYDDVPNHVRTFIERAKHGDYNGTLFTRVIKDFMIQGGSPDSKNAPAGARCGFGDPSAEILPELNSKYFHKKGALAAPRQNDDINPQKKSDMSQFFIVQGKVYRNGELDTLERIKNQNIRKKALKEYYQPVRLNLQMLKHDNPREYNKQIAAINAKIDSVIQATPGHLIFTDEQRKAYTTIGGCHHLDGIYTIYGEITEGLDIIDQIASQPKDQYDRPKKDIRIISIRIE
ncbi:peptidylprolyl isomerase [Parabacteroides bouchesdurhonensis]|uniref:peptidylprolyl isomerase n=1 Tax=Parabacteroides bouchesdurhonensis TaxID=1936995 RepID=UPI000C819CB1|nr:peptidylprolyl isomerase [Parabacteroides bouchesdurhonensis]